MRPGPRPLPDVTNLTVMDRSALSKLETGQRANPTIETLVRYAEARHRPKGSQQTRRGLSRR